MKVATKFKLSEYPARLDAVRFIQFLQRLGLLRNLRRLSVQRYPINLNVLGRFDVAGWEDEEVMEIELEFKD